jgi:prepilin-type processing-associated H-X9-DG protein
MLNENAYLCPSDREGDPLPTPPGGGGDGRSTYSMNAYLGYADPDRLVGTARSYKAPNYNVLVSAGLSPRHWTPSEMFIFVEEHPYWYKNVNMEGNFNFQDKISTRHNLSSSPDPSKPSGDVGMAGKSGSGRTNIAYLDGHIEFPVFNGLADAGTVFHKTGMPVDLAPTGIDSAGTYSRFLHEFMYYIPVRPW